MAPDVARSTDVQPNRQDACVRANRFEAKQGGTIKNMPEWSVKLRTLCGIGWSAAPKKNRSEPAERGENNSVLTVGRSGVGGGSKEPRLGGQRTQQKSQIRVDTALAACPARPHKCCPQVEYSSIQAEWLADLAPEVRRTF